MREHEILFTKLPTGALALTGHSDCAVSGYMIADIIDVGWGIRCNVYTDGMDDEAEATAIKLVQALGYKVVERDNLVHSENGWLIFKNK